MQEEVENRTLVLIVNGAKFTGRLMKNAISKYLAHRKTVSQRKQLAAQNPVIPHGKQTVKQLLGQGKGVSNVELTDPSVLAFDRIARKYGVDYAVRKDRSTQPPRFLIFFKSQDAAALQAALAEYTQKKARAASRPSIIARLHQLGVQVKHAIRHRTRQRGQRTP